MHNIVYKTLGLRLLREQFYPALAFVSADSDEVRNPQHFIHVTVGGHAMTTVQTQTEIQIIDNSKLKLTF